MKHLATLLAAGLLTACGTFQTTIQSEEGTYLQIVGDPDDATLVVDTANPIRLGKDTRSFRLNDKEVTKIAIAPGTHRITISRNQQTIVDRQIYVSSGNAAEVTLP